MIGGDKKVEAKVQVPSETVTEGEEKSVFGNKILDLLFDIFF